MAITDGNMRLHPIQVRMAIAALGLDAGAVAREIGKTPVTLRMALRGERKDGLLPAGLSTEVRAFLEARGIAFEGVQGGRFVVSAPASHSPDKSMIEGRDVG